jgi:Cu2+-exporting ATPase
MAIIMVVSIGNYYESRLKRKKNSLLAQLMNKRIKQARVQRNGHITTVDLEDLSPGDRVIVKAGEQIPVDGKIVKGKGVVNEALMTGESLPVSKQQGDRVVSGTILIQNALTIEIGSQVESTVDKMIQMMWNIQASHSGKQRLVDRISTYFIPAVLFLGAITFLYRIAAGYPMTSSLLSALAVLIVSCPCALGLATPLAVASGLREALKNNIIFKTGAVFEKQGKTDILALDKTGTLTTGNMHLLDNGCNMEALGYAQAIEEYSSHPLASAITAEKLTGVQFTVKNFRSYSNGVSGVIEGTKILVGQPEWLQEQNCVMAEDQQNKIKEARQHGHVPTGIAWNGKVRSVLVIGDRIRDEAEPFVASVKKQHKKIAIITGDSEVAARPIQAKLQPDFLFPGARPESKTKIVSKLKKFGPVAMVGDGSNDALALAEADVGIAFGDLTAIAAESSQIVIPGDRLQKITTAFDIINQTKLRIRQNLGWAFLYNVTTIPLAIAGLLNPLFAALAMATSSLFVVSNSSRKMKLEKHF